MNLYKLARHETRLDADKYDKPIRWRDRHGNPLPSLLDGPFGFAGRALTYVKKDPVR